MVEFDIKQDGDRTVSDVALGSLRCRRIGGTIAKLAKLLRELMVGADRYISCMDGSVMILVELSGRQLDWNRMETFSSPGDCSSTFRRSMVISPRSGLVCTDSSVMWGKVWDPRNDEIPLKHNLFKFRKRHSRRPKGRPGVDKWLVLWTISKECNVGMGLCRCCAIRLKSGELST